MEFKGTDYLPKRDHSRLLSQHTKVKMAALGWPGEWFTMAALAGAVGEPPASVERQIRYLRDPKHGGYQVDKRHAGGGLFEYRVRWALAGEVT